MRSFSDPRTHFEVVKSTTPPTVDGFAINEPTGEIRCCECGESHFNIDEIPHSETCKQRFVHSQWYAGSMDEDGV